MKHGCILVFASIGLIGCFDRAPESPRRAASASLNTLVVRECKRILLDRGETLTVEQNFSVSNNQVTAVAYTLESKSCGCLDYLPKNFVLAPGQSQIVALKGQVTGGYSPRSSGYTATYRNDDNARLQTFVLDIWSCPPAELERSQNCDGRIVWRTIKEERENRPVECSLAFYGLEQADLEDLDCSLYSADTKVICACHPEDCVLDPRTGFWSKRVLLRFESEGLDVERSGGVSLRLSAMNNRLSLDVELRLQLRASVRVVPSSVFFRVGYAAARSVVLHSEEEFDLASSVIIPKGVTYKVDRPNGRLAKILFNYDGSEQNALRTDAEMSVLGAEASVIQVPVYFMGDEASTGASYKHDEDNVEKN